MLNVNIKNTESTNSTQDTLIKETFYNLIATVIMEQQLL